MGVLGTLDICRAVTRNKIGKFAELCAPSCNFAPMPLNRPIDENSRRVYFSQGLIWLYRVTNTKVYRPVPNARSFTTYSPTS